MGYKITKKTRYVILFILLISISTSIALFYPATKKILSSYSIEYFTYKPKAPVEGEIDTYNMPAAQAVPVLIYHGVVRSFDEENTTQTRFIEQMEALKRNGYETVSIKEYDLFRQDKFTLPPKPIIITFDDGRKDSYYPTDDIFRQLGFKVTMFAATGPTINENPFYLSFDEYKTLKASGRWEIEAHGRDSHKIIPINEKGGTSIGSGGRYLLWRQYLFNKGRLETPQEFRVRVEADYVNNVNDLKRRVAVIPRYYAIPLNDYGQQKQTNYADAPEVSHKIISKYFRLAFIIGNDPSYVNVVRQPLYNTKNKDPHRIVRIEVKNMRAQDLIEMLRVRAQSELSQ